jgi:hypothetical protein
MMDKFYPLILHFDDVYLYQRRLRAIGREIDLRGMSGIRYLCPLERIEILDARIPYYKKAITFLGSGDFHYITYILLRRIDEPFNLLLLDNHLDIKETFSGFISCGSWLKNTLEIETLRYVFYIGSGITDGYDRIIKVDSNLEQLSLALRTGIPLYISIDKDVLNNSSVETNWDQGYLDLDELLEILSSIPISIIIGVDVCGEPRPNPFDSIVRKSEEVNLRLISLFYGRKDKRIIA